MVCLKKYMETTENDSLKELEYKVRVFIDRCHNIRSHLEKKEAEQPPRSPNDEIIESLSESKAKFVNELNIMQDSGKRSSESCY